MRSGATTVRVLGAREELRRMAKLFSDSFLQWEQPAQEGEKEVPSTGKTEEELAKYTVSAACCMREGCPPLREGDPPLADCCMQGGIGLWWALGGRLGPSLRAGLHADDLPHAA